MVQGKNWWPHKEKEPNAMGHAHWACHGHAQGTRAGTRVAVFLFMAKVKNVIANVSSISGLVAEYIVAIDVTQA